MADRRPVVGLLCCNEIAGRAVQVVASRFLEPLSMLTAATVLLVPTSSNAGDILAISQILDGLLLTGSRSNIAARRYGGDARTVQTLDETRDEVALALAGRMIEAGKPVYGVCRGLQEINVLFGGTLSSERCAGRHHLGSWETDMNDCSITVTTWF
ncbi:gamma-glutamyl-gamma-aminobutyrate hydrolase family protein [uncultured Sphingomonas sp.]|uniref:gamma-glutamyl-gamma-aminobutyrate hydrolase family protein n=1 Tax=uncultured Sphingomonas sp. TaxID=158754 RepID=UPI0035CB9481